MSPQLHTSGRGCIWINERCPSYKEREFLSGQWQSPVGPPLSDKELRARIRAHHQKYGGDARGD